ncbi:Ig-like domain-containing protein [Butyrivibrio sp. VCD2006]|uniref:Ig-like domain-containing protein n=1 Tax=Butyrivibrio sp. VCD2006 TaxID=1280664 RepID=UPI00047EDCA2|nr:Ig-like domain-containing protein [Butyrivibrio sp. VCD2006]
MRVSIRKLVKKASVLLFAMLIFFQMVPFENIMRVKAAQVGDVIEVETSEDDEEFSEEDEVEIEVEEEEDDETADTASQDAGTSSGNTQGQTQTSQNDAQSQDTSQIKKQDSQDSEKKTENAKKYHRKLTCEVSSEKPKYYDKMSIGDDLRVTVKANKKKIKNRYLSFSSNKRSVATVTEDGVITAKKNGTARIKIVNKKKKSQKCFIYITVAKSSVRTLFIGDSRTVDLFSGTAECILGEVHNDVVVCAFNGGKITFLKEVINHSDLNDYDTIITWMGCNDYGAFKPYSSAYSKLMAKKKKLVLCSVGPTSFGYLDEGGQALFNDRVISSFNVQLKTWADKKKVKTVPMYEYVSKNVTIDSKDGVHYSPKPNKPMWNYILDSAE